MHWLGLAAVGLAAGGVGALLGVGGGVVIVPVLHLGLGLPLPVAVGTSLVVIVGTSVAGTWGYRKRGLVLVRTGVELVAAAALGALAASRWAGELSEEVVARIFAVALAGAAVYLLWRGRAVGGSETPAQGSRRFAAISLAPLAGAASGLLGIGGGLVQVPILRLVLGVEMRRAVATSTFTVGITAALAAWAYGARGEIGWEWVPPLLIGVLIGARAAPRIGDRLPRRALEWGFSALLLYGAWRMAGA